MTELSRQPTIGRRSILAAAILATNLVAVSPVGAADLGRVTATRLDGTTVVGPLVAFAGDSLRIDAEAVGRTNLSTDELLSLELAPPKNVATPSTTLEFANGDRVLAEIGIVEGDLLTATFFGRPLQVPLEMLRGVAFARLAPDDGSAVTLLRDRGADDLVLLTNGDRLSGEFVGLSELELRLETDGRDVRVPRDRIALLAFSPELTAPATIDGPHQIVQSATGWLTVHELTGDDDGSWRGTTAFGASVIWPAGAVSRIGFAGGRTVFLSDLRPRSFEFVPYLDRTWPLRADRAVTGEPLAIGDVVYPKGLGTHSRSRIAYDLDGRYRSFRAVIGLSPSAGKAGSVEFAVEVDGREVYRSESMTAADAKPVTVDLVGAERLVLTVDFGRNGDVRDRANWCDGFLVKLQEPLR